MSVIPVIIMHCDACADERTFDNVGVKEARALAKASGWRTGLKCTSKRSSEYDTRYDECPSCANRSGHA